jgi:hypothetical protein
MHPGRSPALSVLGPLAVVLGVACGASKPRVVASVSPASRVPSAPPEVSTIPTASVKATLRLSSSWSRCHATFSVGPEDVRSEVGRLAGGCAAATAMHRVGEPFGGEQGASDRPQTFRWKARAGHCYRTYGVGAPAIKNLDLLVTDSRGVTLGQDGRDERAPVVPDAGIVCFKEDDDAAVVVSVGDGKGAFAVELWED